MTLSEDVLDNASYFGRIFARCGGLADAVAQGLKEHGIEDFDLKACSCDGIELAAQLCSGRARVCSMRISSKAWRAPADASAAQAALTHGEKNKKEVDKYGMEAHERHISDAISILNNNSCPRSTERGVL